MRIGIEKEWLDIPHTTAMQLFFKTRDDITRTSQIICLPSNKETHFYAKMMLLIIFGVMSYQRHTLNLQYVLGESKPHFDRRDSCNKDFQDMMEYTYQYVQHGGDEKEATRLFEMFDLMFMQVHEYYRQFDSI